MADHEALTVRAQASTASTAPRSTLCASLCKSRAQVPARPPAQTAFEVEGGPAAGRYLPLDHAGRAHLHHRTHPLPDLAAAAKWRPAGRPVRPAVGVHPGWKMRQDAGREGDATVSVVTADL